MAVPVRVGDGVRLGVTVPVEVGVAVRLGVEVADAVDVAVEVRVGVAVGVSVGVALRDGVAVGVALAVGVGVGVRVGVALSVIVTLGVREGVRDGGTVGVARGTPIGRLQARLVPASSRASPPRTIRMRDRAVLLMALLYGVVPHAHATRKHCLPDAHPPRGRLASGRAAVY